MSESFFSRSKYVKELDNTVFDKDCYSCIDIKEPTILLYYAPWCPYCVKIKDVYEELGKKMLCTVVASLDCEKYKTIANKIREDAPGILKGYPSICLYKNGKFVSRHEGDRDIDTFIKVCKKLCKD